MQRVSVDLVVQDRTLQAAKLGFLFSMTGLQVEHIRMVRHLLRLLYKLVSRLSQRIDLTLGEYVLNPEVSVLVI